MVREQKNMLKQGKIIKNCGNYGNMEMQGNFGREQGPPLQGCQSTKSSNIENL